MAWRSLLAVLLLALAGTSALAGRSDESPAVSAGAESDAALFEMPDCNIFSTGTRIESEAELRRFVADRCKGAAPVPAFDFARGSLLGVHVALDCHGSARIAVRRDDAARVVHVHTVSIYGGCRAMGRGRTYWVRIPKASAGYRIVLTGGSADRAEWGALAAASETESAEPTASAVALARSAAAAVVVVDTLEAGAGADDVKRSSGYAMRDGRVVTSAGAIKGAASVRVRRPGAEKALPAAAVVGLDLVHDVCVLEVPGLDVEPVRAATVAPTAAGRIYVAASLPDGTIEPESEYVRGASAAGFVELSSPLSRDAFGAPVFDAAGAVVGVATPGRGRDGRAIVVPVAHLDAADAETRMPANAAGYLARTDAERAGFVYGRPRRVTETARPAAGASPTPTPAPRVTTWEYDSRGMLARHETRSGESFDEVRYAYDARGLLASTARRGAHSGADAISRSVPRSETVAAAARLGGATRLEEARVGGGKIVRHLDRKGASVRVEEIDASGTLVRETFYSETYDMVTRVLETVPAPEGERRVVSETTFEYALDELSSWTRRTTRVRHAGEKGSGTVTEVAERAIEYYAP